MISDWTVVSNFPVHFPIDIIFPRGNCKSARVIAIVAWGLIITHVSVEKGSRDRATGSVTVKTPTTPFILSAFSSREAVILVHSSWGFPAILKGPQVIRTSQF